MTEPAPNEVTRCLQRIDAGDPQAVEELLPRVYADLRGVAENLFRDQWRQHTLQPTALVHEAYLRLAGPKAGGWENKRHFLRVAAMAMRQVLTDYARGRATQKRRAEGSRVDLGDVGASEGVPALDLIELEQALTELEQLDERQARIVELRFLGGLTVAETAEALGVSERTAFVDWNMARSWLLKRMS